MKCHHRSRPQFQLTMTSGDHRRRRNLGYIAKKFGWIHAWAADGKHGDPAWMKQFYSSAATFTNDAELRK